MKSKFHRQTNFEKIVCLERQNKMNYKDMSEVIVRKLTNFLQKLPTI